MRTITTADVWTWMQANCNANEIAAYGGFSVLVALAWMSAARSDFVRSHGKQTKDL